MERELVGVIECRVAIMALEGFAYRRVQKPRACLSQLGVDHLLEQRMGEIVVDRVDASCLRQYSLSEQLVDTGDDIDLGQPGDFRQRLIGGARADHRGEIRERSRFRRQAVDSSFQDVANRGRELESLHLPTGPAPVFLRQRPGIDQRLESLLDEERIATSPVVQHRREMMGHGLLDSESLLDDFLHLLLFERIELPHREASEARERLLGAPQNCVGVALGFDVRPEQNDPLALDLARDEMEQFERGGVGPLKILENDEQRFFRREPSEELCEVPQQACLDLGGIRAGGSVLAIR